MPPSNLYIVYSSAFNAVSVVFGFNFEDAVSYALRNGGSVYTYNLVNENAIPKTPKKDR